MIIEYSDDFNGRKTGGEIESQSCSVEEERLRGGVGSRWSFGEERKVLAQ